MSQKSGPEKEPPEQVAKEIRRGTRRQFSAEEKIRIVLSGLRRRQYCRAVPPRRDHPEPLLPLVGKSFLEAELKSAAGFIAMPREAIPNRKPIARQAFARAPSRGDLRGRNHSLRPGRRFFHLKGSPRA